MTRVGPVAWLTGEYPRATDTFIQREVAALREHGFEVHTCSIRRTGAEHIVGPEQRAEQASTFHVLPATANLANLLRAQVAGLRRPGRYLRALRLAWQTAPKGVKGRLYNLVYFAEATVLAEQLREQGITHLHNHIAKSSCSVAMLASELSGVPFSFTLHGPDIFFAPEHWRLDEKIARAQFVACISNFARSQAMLYSAGEHWSKLHIIHCGIQPERYRATSEPGTGRLVFVGRLAAVKGVAVLLQALAKARQSAGELSLTLIGDGPERASIEAEVRRLGLGEVVTFTGYLGQDAVAEHLQSASALVLPSFAEGVPVVLMEAMAAGLPVVATRVGGVAELVADGVSGVIVAPGDEDALAQAIITVATNPDLACEMGSKGREIVVRDFEITAEAQRLGELIEAYHQGERPARRRSTLQ